MIFLKCKICFIYVGFNCNRKKWGEKCLEICAIKGGGGVGRLTTNTILNFHFDYPQPSLTASHRFVVVWMTVLVQRLYTEEKTRKAVKVSSLNFWHFFQSKFWSLGSGSFDLIDYVGYQNYSSYTWCLGFPAEGDPSISFLVDFNRSISNYNSMEHTTKMIVDVTILNCKVGPRSDSPIPIFQNLPETDWTWTQQEPDVRVEVSSSYCSAHRVL